MASPNLTVFQAIANFINDLSTCVPNIKALTLYRKLLDQTTLSHKEPIQNHIRICTESCVENNGAILSKELLTAKISYSKNVFIDFAIIFTRLDDESKSSVFKHLQYISLLTETDSSSKDAIIKELTVIPTLSEQGVITEENFFTDILSQLKSSIPENIENPQATIAEMMSGSVLTNIMSTIQNGMNSGELDQDKLIKVMFKNITDMKDQIEKDGGDVSQFDMMTSMMGQFELDK